MRRICAGAPARQTAAIAVVAMLLAVACGSSDDTAAEPELSGGNGTSASVPDDQGATERIANVSERDTSPGADGVVVNEVVEGTNDFAIGFFKTALAGDASNAVIGNYSLSSILLLTMTRTGGATHELGLPTEYDLRLLPGPPPTLWSARPQRNKAV